MQSRRKETRPFPNTQPTWDSFTHCYQPGPPTITVLGVFNQCLNFSGTKVSVKGYRMFRIETADSDQLWRFCEVNCGAAEKGRKIGAGLPWTGHCLPVILRQLIPAYFLLSGECSHVHGDWCDHCPYRQETKGTFEGVFSL